MHIGGDIINAKEVVKRVMLSSRMKSNGHKVKHKKFHLNVRKNFTL